MTLPESSCLHEYTNAGGSVHSTNNQNILRKLVDREVIHCCSSLVSHFASHTEACVDGVDYDDVLSLCTGKGWEEPGIEYLDCMDRDELLEWMLDNDFALPNANGELDNTLTDEEVDEDVAIDAGGRLTDDELRAMVKASAMDWQLFCDRFRVDQYDIDVLEHWCVTSWFQGKLSERGEVVGDLLDFNIWGRTCSGQAIYIDLVIAEIAAEMQILDGQKNSWAG